MKPRTSGSAPNHLKLPVISMRSNVIWTFVGNGCFLGCQYLMLMATAKLGDPTLLGQYALAIAICSPVIIASQMQLRQVQATDVREEYDFATYMGLRAICTVLAILVIGGLIVLGRYSQTLAYLILIMAIAKGFESLSDAAYGKLQRSERMDLIAISLAGKGLLSALVFIALLWWTRDLFWPTTGLALVLGAFFFRYDLPAAVNWIGAWKSLPIRNWGVIRSLFLLTIPLGLTTGLQSFSSNLPRYFLEATHGQNAVAIFAVASAPLSLLALFNGAISQATMSRAATHFQTGNLQAFNRLNWQILIAPVVIGCLFTGLFALWGEPLLATLFTSEYTSGAPLLVVMSAGLAFGSLTSIGSTILNAARAYKLQLLVIVVVVTLQFPLSYYLILNNAGLGAAWSECARHCFFVVFLSMAGSFAKSPQRLPANPMEQGRVAA